jgi:5-enolpyruvylshikimate-3-phosphate synthase
VSKKFGFGRNSRVDLSLRPRAIDALIKGIAAAGGHQVTSIHMETDHSYSDHRIALESAVIKWLAGLR